MDLIKRTAKAAAFKLFTIKGTRWFQRSAGSTYHKAHVSGLCKETNEWVDLGSSEMQYGYDEQYNVTGGALLIKLGYFENVSDKSDESVAYEFGKYSVRERMGVQCYHEDVKRQRDL